MCARAKIIFTKKIHALRSGEQHLLPFWGFLVGRLKTWGLEPDHPASGHSANAGCHSCCWRKKLSSPSQTTFPPGHCWAQVGPCLPNGWESLWALWPLPPSSHLAGGTQCPQSWAGHLSSVLFNCPICMQLGVDGVQACSTAWAASSPAYLSTSSVWLIRVFQILRLGRKAVLIKLQAKAPRGLLGGERMHVGQHLSIAESESYHSITSKS